MFPQIQLQHEDEDDEFLIGVCLHNYRNQLQIQIQYKDDDDELLIGVCLHSRLGAAFTYDFLLTRQTQ